MHMMVRRRGRLLASGLAALALTVTGCGTGTETGEGDLADATPSPSATPSQSPEPVDTLTPDGTPTTEQPSPAAESPSPASQPPSAAPQETPEETPDPVARSIRGKLLAADELPGFNDEFTWRVKTTRMREGRQPFGTCHKFAMTSIGASKVMVRTYVPAQKSPGSTASNLVAEFADEMTAKRAYEVLKSWSEQCEEELQGYDRTDVGRLESVSVNGAVGNWYLLGYGPAGDPDSSYFDAQGLTRVRRSVSVLQMRLVGQDYNYPRGEEPMVAAVQGAAARIR